ncbi:YidC/Oxa1 family membrane protein insertase [Kitasatospora paranensis]|uniref:Membrane protein insertase YidC n=1 Tax=Kitasatospora paranensis TaxID=258053 RepID=A0ABW2G1K4_9ACTN
MSLFAVLDPAVRLAHDAVSALAQAVPTALAVVLFTVAVRLALHPLARAAARGEKARLRLAPRVAELQRTHKGRPEKLRAALAELYRAERTSPLAGILPMLVQIPFFSVMYRLFTTPNDLLGHTLAGVPLGLHVGDAHGPAQLVVFAGLYAALAAVGYAGFRRARRAAAGGSPAPSAGSAPAGAPVRVPGGALLPYLSFGTVLFAAFVPLAAGLYLLTTTAWTAAERAWLHRETPGGAAPVRPVATTA